MVFNTVYNDVHAFKKKLNSLDSILHYLDEKNTNYEAQKEFLDFMNENFPDTKLQEVFDLVSSTYLQWSFLGSYAIDTSINGAVHSALEKNMRMKMVHQKVIKQCFGNYLIKMQ